MTENSVLSVAAAARFLGKSEAAVRQDVARRKLPFRKAGRRVLFLERELREYLEGLPGLRVEELQVRERGGGR